MSYEVTKQRKHKQKKQCEVGWDWMGCAAGITDTCTSLLVVVIICLFVRACVVRVLCVCFIQSAVSTLDRHLLGVNYEYIQVFGWKRN